MSDDNSGPYVQVAAFCEKALIEQGGGLSLIGFADQVMRPTLDQAAGSTPVSLTLVICLWAGSVTQPGIVKVRPITPSNKQLPDLDITVGFTTAGANGVNIIHPMQLLMEEAGQYWFDVWFAEGTGHKERLISRIPILLVNAEPATTPSGLAASP